jgi:hypothetical protein
MTKQLVYEAYAYATQHDASVSYAVRDVPLIEEPPRPVGGSSRTAALRVQVAESVGSVEAVKILRQIADHVESNITDIDGYCSIEQMIEREREMRFRMKSVTGAKQ